jgi:hypothetical protein
MHGSDVLLTTPDGSPYVIVDEYPSRWLMKEALFHAQSVARASNAQFAVATDAERFVVLDLRSDALDATEGRPSKGFPSPHDLDLDVPHHDKPQLGFAGGKPSLGVSLIRCDSVSTFETAIANAASPTAIVDFTVPWGDRWER